MELAHDGIVHRAFEHPVRSALRPLRIVHRRVGVACFPADGADVETLLRNADTAMYNAKRSQRGSYRMFEGSMHDSVVRKFHLESELRGALTAKELLVHYEPVVSIDGAIIGTVDRKT